jgi:hypothetical protein
MQVQQLLNADVDGCGIVEFLQLLQGKEIYVVRRVDGLRSSEDAVGYGDSSSEDGRIFNIVDSVPVNPGPSSASTWTYRSDAVWSIATTLVMMARLSGGSLSHELNAAISCFRMSLPGCCSR